MQVCYCTLAGTKACVGCPNNHNYDMNWGYTQTYYPVKLGEPNMDKYREDLKRVFKELNELNLKLSNVESIKHIRI